jgi:outer membrane protein assembly factor BamB
MPRGRGRRWLVLLTAAFVVVVAGAAVAYKLTRPPGDVSNPDVPFVDSTPTPTATPKPKGTKKKPAVDDFRWPNYGYTADHRRAYNPPQPIEPPFHRVWYRPASALLEFPPAIADGMLIQLADNARLVAVNKNNGKVRWRRQLGSLSASTPAVAGDMLFVSILEQRRGTGRGRIVGLKLNTGKVVWSRSLSARSESSPLVDHGKVYVGTESGQLLALSARSGRVQWTYQAFGAIKGSPTLSDGNLYFGDYGGRVQAVRTSDGHRVWDSGGGGNLLRAAHFYATAAVAFGRVYIGNTDGREYSFSAKDGRIAWAKQTGNYVYSSAAVQDVDGLGPTVFFGSYDGTFYALDARSGNVRWRFRSSGKISGSPTIIGRIVYFSDLGKRMTYGLSTRSGRVMFKKTFGGFDPATSDGRHLFVTGGRSIGAYLPVKKKK